MLERLSPTTRTVLRAATGIAIGIASGFATLILWFVGAITLTGCFFECSSDPNVVGGAFLLAAAVLFAAFTVTSVVWGAIGWNRRVLVRVAATVAALATLAVLVSLAGF